ncbi:MAG: histidine kinase, partial [Bacteroidota bacterium]
MNTHRQMNEWTNQALKTQMNPHFVFNALNAIQYFILSDDKKSAVKYLSIFSKLLRYHLKYYEAETVALGEELQMLEWYLQLQKLRYEGLFNYQWLKKIKGKEQQLKIPRMVLSA